MRRLALLAALTAIVLLAVAGPAAARYGMPDALTERGRTIESIYAQIFIAGTVVFVVVFALLAYVIVRYREGSGHGRATHERERHDLKAEMLWTGVPLLIVLWVGLISYQGLAKLDQELDARDAAFEIQVTGSQWNWLAEYPGGVALYADPNSENGTVLAQNHFLVPANVPILWNITASDVIHAFHLADLNRATVQLIDANPAGPHRYNHFVAALEEGTYPVQCREMCLNPGHAYMRAVVRAVPQAEYDHWLQGRQLVVGAELVQDVQLTVNARGLSVTENQTVVVDTRVRVEVQNERDAPVTLSAPGAEPVTIPAKGRGWFAFNVSDESPRDLEVEGVGRIGFRGIEAEVIEVALGDYVLQPDTIDVQAGTTYLIQVRNVHNVAHNLYIGNYRTEIVAQSATIAGGQSTSFIYTPRESGQVDMWCDVPGHVDLGMIGDVHIE